MKYILIALWFIITFGCSLSNNENIENKILVGLDDSKEKRSYFYFNKSDANLYTWKVKVKPEYEKEVDIKALNRAIGTPKEYLFPLDKPENSVNKGWSSFAKYKISNNKIHLFIPEEEKSKFMDDFTLKIEDIKDTVVNMEKCKIYICPMVGHHSLELRFLEVK
jgi:hypothetical protein